MSEEKWTMHGLADDDPRRLKSAEELARYIREVGFLPLFRNGIAGFSVEENVSDRYWWSDDPERDPWYWRILLCSRDEIAYGKFFDGKAGFVHRDWFPFFACMRRDGYDFDARADEGLAKRNECRIMEAFSEDREILSAELRRRTAIKSFESAVSALEEKTYLITAALRQKINQKGQPYGWHVGVYTTPEHKWGEAFVTSAYCAGTAACTEKVVQKIRGCFPNAPRSEVQKLIIGYRRMMV